MIQAAVVLAFIVGWMIGARMIRARRLRLALTSPSVAAAAKFWADSLRPNFEFTEEKRAEFCTYLREALADHYARNSTFPLIGVFFYEPYHEGVDPVIWECMRRVGLVYGFNRDIDHLHMSNWGRTHITLSATWITNGVGENRHEIWPPAYEGHEVAVAV